MNDSHYDNLAPEMSALLSQLDEYLSAQGIEAYLVGGFVRDLLLQRPVADIDIAIKASAREIGPGIAEALNGTFVLLDEKNDIARIILAGETQPGIVDVSSFKRSIQNDLERRDFTIDAMAVNLAGSARGINRNDIIDPFDGQRDIQEKTIRAFDERVFVLDAVRLLRAVRLGHELGFTIEPETEDLILEYGHLIFDVPGERIRDELIRLLVLPEASKVLRYLDDLGMLTSIFSELENGRGMEQPKEHHWDVLEHSLATVEALEYILGEGSWPHVSDDVLSFVPISDHIRTWLDTEVSGHSTRKVMLKLAALLHDTGKPSTKAIDETGRMRFLGHPQEGAGLVTPMLEKLRFSTKEIRIIEMEILNHMRPTQMSQEGLPTDRAIYRYFRDLGETGLDIFFLNLADHLAARGPGLIMEGWKEHNSLVEYVIRKRRDKENIVNPPKIIDGYDIMKSLGLDAGPRVGELIEAVREAQASGEIEGRDQALSFVKKLVQNGDFPSEGNDAK